MSSDYASGEVTPFIKVPDIFSSRLPHTPEKATAIGSTSDLSFIHNLLKREKIEQTFNLAYSMFKAGNILFILFDRQGDFLSPTNTSQEMDTWKGKAGTM